MHGVIIYLFISNLSLELVLCLAIKEDFFMYNITYFVRNFVKI